MTLINWAINIIYNFRILLWNPFMPLEQIRRKLRLDSIFLFDVDMPLQLWMFRTASHQYHPFVYSVCLKAQLHPIVYRMVFRAQHWVETVYMFVYVADKLTVLSLTSSWQSDDLNSLICLHLHLAIGNKQLTLAFIKAIAITTNNRINPAGFLSSDR